MPDGYSLTIESKSHDLSVTIETHDEHHMGCSSVFIICSRPIGNVSRFQTTNGNALFTPEGDGLIIYDACVILLADLNANEVYHWKRPAKWYFTRVRIEDQWLLADLYDSGGRQKANRPIPLVDISTEFTRGLGPVCAGRFPSAYP